MDNTNMLVEAKKDFTKRLVDILRPHMLDGFKSIYNDVVNICKTNKSEEFLLVFQRSLTQVPNWSQELILTEYDRIQEASKCDWLDKLITTTLAAHAKVLTIMNNKNKKKAIDEVVVKIPKPEYFLHKCYINTARQFWKYPYLFSNKVNPSDYQRNMRDCENLISESIEETIRVLLPFKHFLQDSLKDEYESEEEEKIDEDKNSKNVKKLVSREAAMLANKEEEKTKDNFNEIEQFVNQEPTNDVVEEIKEAVAEVKEEPKEEVKEEVKEVPKEEVKEPKEEVKEVPKEEVKEVPKEEVKEPKEEVKEVPKEEVKDMKEEVKVDDTDKMLAELNAGVMVPNITETITKIDANDDIDAVYPEVKNALMNELNNPEVEDVLDLSLSPTPALEEKSEFTSDNEEPNQLDSVESDNNGYYNDNDDDNGKLGGFKTEMSDVSEIGTENDEYFNDLDFELENLNKHAVSFGTSNKPKTTKSRFFNDLDD